MARRPHIPYPVVAPKDESLILVRLRINDLWRPGYIGEATLTYLLKYLAADKDRRVELTMDSCLPVLWSHADMEHNYNVIASEQNTPEHYRQTVRTIIVDLGWSLSRIYVRYM